MWDSWEVSFKRRGCAIVPLFLHPAAGNLDVMAKALAVILNMEAKPVSLPSNRGSLMILDRHSSSGLPTLGLFYRKEK